MWTLKGIKERAKEEFQKNRVKSIMVSLIIIFLGIGISSGLSWSNLFSSKSEPNYTITYNTETHELIYSNQNRPYDESSESVAQMIVFSIMILTILVNILLIVFKICILNPLNVGVDYFFVNSIKKEAKVSSIARPFDNAYINIVSTMFSKNVYQVLWTMLFIVPGVIKQLEYFMIPYLLGEFPNIDKEMIFLLSKELMKGHKKKTFFLQLSFLPYMILSFFTLGLLNILYVEPYMRYANAVLYKEILNQGRENKDNHILSEMLNSLDIKRIDD